MVLAGEYLRKRNLEKGKKSRNTSLVADNLIYKKWSRRELKGAYRKQEGRGKGVTQVEDSPPNGQAGGYVSGKEIQANQGEDPDSHAQG